MHQVTMLSNYSLQQLSNTYDGLIDSIKLLDSTFDRQKIGRFRSKQEGIEHVISLLSILVFKYGLFMNMCQMATVTESSNFGKPRQQNENAMQPENACFVNFNGYTGKRLPRPKNRDSCNLNNTRWGTRKTRKEQILEILEDGPKTYKHIADTIGITQRNVSTVVTKLRQDGKLIRVTKVADRTYEAELCN